VSAASPAVGERPERLPEALRLFSVSAEARPLAGDVGSRRYFRAGTRGGTACLLVLYPEPLSPAQASWTAIGTALAATGLRVPALLHDAPELGAALVEDLGDRDLGHELAEAPREDGARLLDEAEELLYGVRAVARSAATRNPSFSAAFFAGELDHTRHWAIEAGGSRPLSAERREEWEAGARALAEAAASPDETGDFVATHRDYHANNLMRAPDGTLALLDFQDLRLGPPDYDPVSLRCERGGEAVDGDPPGVSEAVLLQRAWKVLGTFEKMLSLGREVYRPHREAAIRVLHARTRRGGRFAPLLSFLA
jgi:aminoglycoside/choline kinase family phosphotransferase